MSGRPGHLVLLALILAVAALLRLYDLDRTSLWYDEAVSWSQSKGSLGELLEAVATDNYPPLHNVLLWVTMPVLGNSETALRLPSAMLGIFAVMLMAPIGTLLAGRSAGLAAAALLALSPFHIWYSTEARMYALLAATGLLFLLATLKVLQRPTRFWLCALALGGALFLYSHIYALLGFAAVGLACAVCALRDVTRTKSVKESSAFQACLAMAVSTLLFLPWLVILANRARSVADEGFWIAYPDLPFLKGLVFNIAGSLTLFWLLLALALIGLLLALTLPKRACSSLSNLQAVIVCSAYTFGPPLLAYLYSVLVQPILFDRYLMAAWPGLLLLAVTAAQRLLPNMAPLALLVATLYLSFPELKFALLDKIRPEWRLIAQDYQSRREPEDRLMLYKGFAAPALAYYLREPKAFTAATTLEDLQDPGLTDRWLLVAHCDNTETAAAIKAFSARESDSVSQRFGWGASGLRLVKRPEPN
ncbi:glycosyltransferase family 39 protein [Roseibium sediminicola]|uniref:Glycosyltransferase family 39 protein n=1 Tax=Roseibium sediminicola TaxID=2933272 RepID=A0ABT0GWH2_9HYPH|nr:glycosyltransferase family 39 protein [Roseibium sp. CAU 1639]MCK7613575.1 glycosyltransferase family 39 protein [Roseibium sp. CAU 1639]